MLGTEDRNRIIIEAYNRCPDSKPTADLPYRKPKFLKGSVYEEWAIHRSACLQIESKHNLTGQHHLQPWYDIPIESFMFWARTNLDSKEYDKFLEFYIPYAPIDIKDRPLYEKFVQEIKNMASFRDGKTLEKYKKWISELERHKPAPDPATPEVQ